MLGFLSRCLFFLVGRFADLTQDNRLSSFQLVLTVQMVDRTFQYDTLSVMGFTKAIATVILLFYPYRGIDCCQNGSVFDNLIHFFPSLSYLDRNQIEI